jgi:hypothetical protein
MDPAAALVTAYFLRLSGVRLEARERSAAA